MANLLDMLRRRGAQEAGSEGNMMGAMAQGGADPSMLGAGDAQGMGNVQGAGMPGGVGQDAARAAKLAQMAQAMQGQRKAEPAIGPKQIREAAQTLRKYKDGKANYDRTIIENERWYKMRHWEYIRRKDKKEKGVEPSSGWLFNTIMNKHADAMDNYPEPVVLPRERGDVDSAKTLSDVLPVILDRNEFRDTYSDNWWEKLKHGTAVYGVFWNTEKENGLGDIDIKVIDLLKIYWEPGKTKIQDSKNLFIVELADADELAATYPEADKKKFGKSITVSEYIHDENIDTSDKVLVVDWYYKKRVGGRVVLHYVKFCGEALLYATENEPDLRERGLYDHGLYPVVFDRLFPEKDSPVGFGFVAICKDPQMYIDKIMGNVLETSSLNTKRRFFASKNINIDIKQLLDNEQPIVEVEGSVGDLADKLVEMRPRELSGIYPNIAQMKIDEMKDIAGNRDVNSGGTGGGVTAASAIVALQETGNKTSRDSIDAAYRSYVKISTLCIELIRQFYDESRSFRIVGAPAQSQPMMPGMPRGMPAQAPAMPPEAIGGAPMTPGGMPMQDNTRFVELSNKGLKDQVTGYGTDGEPMLRHPVFDLQIKAQKKNPFSREAQNQLATQMFTMGAFNPQMADAALCMLSIMDFEGIEDVRERVAQGQTLFSQVQQLQEQLMQLQAMMQGGAPAQNGGAPI